MYSKIASYVVKILKASCIFIASVKSERKMLFIDNTIHCTVRDSDVQSSKEYVFAFLKLHDIVAAHNNGLNNTCTCVAKQLHCGNYVASYMARR